VWLTRLAHALFVKDGRLRPIFRSVVYLICAYVFAELLAALVAAIALSAGLSPLALTTMASYPAQLISEGCLCASAVGVALLMRRWIDRRSISSLGLSFGRGWARLLLIGVAFGAGMQAIVFAADAALGYSHVIGFAGAGTDAIELVKYVPVLAAVAIAEETIARGYLFQNIWEEWGVVAAALITSALFAAGHLGNPNSHVQLALTLCGLLAYALWACLSVIWTRSLWLVIGLHFSWNLFEGPIFGFPVSGLGFGESAITQTVSGPSWFTGGAFGPEAGAGALLVLALAVAVLWWLHRAGALAAAPSVREAYAAP